MRPYNAPFIAGPIINDSRYFVGYQEQLKTITDRAIAPQPTSLNVIGVKRIGKSSLLKHFCRTYIDKIQSRGQDPKKYLAVYIDLEQGTCHSKSGFFQVVAEKLKRNLEQNYSWYGQPDILIQALTANSFDTDNFNQAMVKFRDQGILPIICLDKIETLLKHPDEFKDDFFDNLRFLMGLNSLMLVIASEKNIKIYRDQKKLTSTFFNDAQTIILQGLTENEARDLVRLPQTTIPGTQAVLSDTQQQIALDWGGKNPYLLQLAGLYLWESLPQQSNKDQTWAKKQFDRHARGISPRHSIGRRFLLGLKWLFWIFPKKLGDGVKFIGSIHGELSSWLIGFVIIGALILEARGHISLASVIKSLFGLGD